MRIGDRGEGRVIFLKEDLQGENVCDEKALFCEETALFVQKHFLCLNQRRGEIASSYYLMFIPWLTQFIKDD